GMSGLVTTPVSQASADQRRGRAGREQPGVCYRLWTEQQQSALPQFSTPEILSADLAPHALELARWGASQGEGLKFLDPPPHAHLAQARGLLQSLGAFDEHDKLSSHGIDLAELPVHPRISHMMLKAKELGLGALACEIAALLEERDLLRGARDTDIDLHSRLHALRNGDGSDHLARERALAQTKRLCALIGVPYTRMSDERAGLLLALAYPERIARRRGDRYQLAGGTVAVLPERSLLAREMFLAIGDVDGVGSEVRIFLAERIDEADLREIFASQMESIDEVRWDNRGQVVIVRRVSKLGAIEISETAHVPDESQIREAMITGIRESGLDSLPWNKESVSIRSRSEWLRLRGFIGDGWPNLSDENLTVTLEEWLGPFLNGVTRLSHLAKLDLTTILNARFSYEQRAILNRLTPTHITVPTGSHIQLDYSGNEPILAVRLQEMFGESESPRIAEGKVRVLLHLLSPAQRPLAVTADLASFWRNAYPDVRKEMRGRYPKHYWPEYPLTAEPTKRRKNK
ncbi:MAG: ATP-dependent helicase C-terminal domain-containing protein, partial [bacterium]